MGLIGNIYGLIGYYNHTKGRTDKALEYYGKAMKKDISIANFQMAYGVLLLKTGRVDEAQELFNRLQVFYPDNASVKTNGRINLALTYWKQGDLDHAVELMTEMHNNLKNSNTYGTLGYLLIETGDLEKALEFNLEALDYDEEDSVALDNLGETYYRMGKYDEAFNYFEKALEEKDNQTASLYHIGCLYQMQGEDAKAREAFEKALKNDINALSTVSREQIEKRLAELNKE